MANHQQTARLIQILTVVFICLCSWIYQAFLSSEAAPSLSAKEFLQKPGLQLRYAIENPNSKNDTDLTYQIAEFVVNSERYIEFLKYDAQDETIVVLGRQDIANPDWYAEYSYCRFKGVWEPEIYALFSMDQLNTSPLKNPKLAIRANRKTEKLEQADARQVICLNRSEFKD